MNDVTNWIQLLTGSSDPGSLWGIFLVGLTIGGLSAIMTQGGLLASAITIRKIGQMSETRFSDHAVPVGVFLIARLIAYTLLGFALGWVGQKILIFNELRIFMQAVIGLYLLAVALHLFHAHPIFQYVRMERPLITNKRSKKIITKNDGALIPFILGLLTVFIPCETTLAMEALAISGGSAVFGALTMAAFILGTIPLFFSLGYLTSTLTAYFREGFTKIAALVIIYFAIIALNSSLVAINSPITLEKIGNWIPIEFNLSGE